MSNGKRDTTLCLPDLHIMNARPARSTFSCTWRDGSNRNLFAVVDEEAAELVEGSPHMSRISGTSPTPKPKPSTFLQVFPHNLAFPSRNPRGPQILDPRLCLPGSAPEEANASVFLTFLPVRIFHKKRFGFVDLFFHRRVAITSLGFAHLISHNS